MTATATDTDLGIDLDAEVVCSHDRCDAVATWAMGIIHPDGSTCRTNPLCNAHRQRMVEYVGDPSIEIRCTRHMIPAHLTWRPL